MNLAATLVLDVTAAGFVALALAMAYRWYRDRGHAQGLLAISLTALGIVAALGRFQDQTHPNVVLSLVTIVAFIASAYLVLLFGNEFIPLERRARLAADVLLGVSILCGILLVTVFQRGPQPVMTALGFEIVGAWAILIGLPIVRFWLASNSLPSVPKARLRVLSLGFAVLIAVLVVDVIGGSALQSPAAIIITQLLALATVPVIYVSFAPPAILRRIWRMSEEKNVRAAMQDLLIFSPTRELMAERAVYWAVRLMGATAGYIVDAKGKVMATSGIDPIEAAELSSSGGPNPTGAAGSIVKAPLHLTEGEGSLAIIAGRFTPVFGTDEITQLNAYAISVSAGLQRAGVTERMTALEKGKTQFLNLASHELRAPLTVIRGYVSMLKNGLFGDLNDSGRKASDVMEAKVSEMNELIEEMMDAARVEEGGLTLRLVECDIRDIVREAVDVASAQLDASHRIALDLQDRRVRVKVDPDRTRTIVTNLLTNALKYSPAGGEVRCQVRSSRSGVARVSVSDEGLGITRDDMATLFTRFGRIITPETEHLRGTGLGLFLSRQLARLQGGDIAVVSTPGSGSTFTLQLPVSGVAGPPPGADLDGETTTPHEDAVGVHPSAPVRR